MQKKESSVLLSNKFNLRLVLYIKIEYFIMGLFFVKLINIIYFLKK